MVDESFQPIVLHVHVAQAPLKCRVSNREDDDVSGDEETYEATRVVDSDDDRLAPPLSPSSTHILQRLLLGRDPLMSNFCDLSQSHRVVADGRLFEGDISLLGSSSVTEKGHVFEDMFALKLW